MSMINLIRTEKNMAAMVAQLAATLVERDGAIEQLSLRLAQAEQEIQALRPTREASNDDNKACEADEQ